MNPKKKIEKNIKRLTIAVLKSTSQDLFILKYCVDTEIARRHLDNDFDSFVKHFESVE